MSSRRLCLILGVLLYGCAHRPKPGLFEAAEIGDVTSMRELLKAGANPSEPHANGLTALIVSARRGCLPCIGELLHRGASPDQPGDNGWTPLLHAIHKNQSGAVQALLAGGAQVDRRDKTGATALMMAAAYGYTPIVEILLDHGADARAVAANGSNVLAAALTGTSGLDSFSLASCHADTVRLLKSRYPDLRLPDNGWARVAQMAGGVAKWRGCGY